MIQPAYLLYSNQCGFDNLIKSYKIIAVVIFLYFCNLEHNIWILILGNVLPKLYKVKKFSANIGPLHVWCSVCCYAIDATTTPNLYYLGALCNTNVCYVIKSVDMDTWWRTQLLRWEANKQRVSSTLQYDLFITNPNNLT